MGNQHYIVAILDGTVIVHIGQGTQAAWEFLRSRGDKVRDTDSDRHIVSAGDLQKALEDNGEQVWVSIPGNDDYSVEARHVVSDKHSGWLAVDISENGGVEGIWFTDQRYAPSGYFEGVDEVSLNRDFAPRIVLSLVFDANGDDESYRQLFDWHEYLA